MKKSTKKNIVKSVLVIILLVFGSIIAIKKLGIGATTLLFSNIRNEDNSIIVCDSNSNIHDYVHVMLESKNSTNIEEGIQFDIINPKGEKVYSGILNDGKTFREDYKNVAGDWKIKLHFENSQSFATIDTGFAINSKKENSMRFE